MLIKDAGNRKTEILVHFNFGLYPSHRSRNYSFSLIWVLLIDFFEINFSLFGESRNMVQYQSFCSYIKMTEFWLVSYNLGDGTLLLYYRLLWEGKPMRS